MPRIVPCSRAKGKLNEIIKCMLILCTWKWSQELQRFVNILEIFFSFQICILHGLVKPLITIQANFPTDSTRDWERAVSCVLRILLLLLLLSRKLWNFQNTFLLFWLNFFLKHSLLNHKVIFYLNLPVRGIS